MVAPLHCVFPILHLHLCRGAQLPKRHRFVLHASFLCMLSLKVVCSFLGRAVHATIVKAVARVLSNRAQLCEWMGASVVVRSTYSRCFSRGTERLLISAQTVCLLGSARGTVDNTYAHIPSYLNFHLFCFILLVFKTNSHHATQNWLQICWVAQVHPKLSNPLLHLPKLWGCKHGTMYLSFFLPILRECLVSIFYLIYLLASSWGVYCLDLGEGCVIFICQVYNCGS